MIVLLVLGIILFYLYMGYLVVQEDKQREMEVDKWDNNRDAMNKFIRKDEKGRL